MCPVLVQGRAARYAAENPLSQHAAENSVSKAAYRGLPGCFFWLGLISGFKQYTIVYYNML